jgi:putative transposase
MKFNPQIHNRRSVRLENYDYSKEGAYFITICCKDRAHLFGEIINGEMMLNANGNIAYNEWLKTTEIRWDVELDVFVIMPNHIHGIIIIKNQIGNTSRGVLHTPRSDGTFESRSDGTFESRTYVSDSQASRADEFNAIKLPFNNIKDVCDDKKSDVCNTSLRSPSHTVGAIVRGYKSAVTKQINIFSVGNCKQPASIWQRSFHEHIIRNGESYQHISNYIVNNPYKWDLDRYHKG